MHNAYTDLSIEFYLCGYQNANVGRTQDSQMVSKTALACHNESNECKEKNKLLGAQRMVMQIPPADLKNTWDAFGLGKAR